MREGTPPSPLRYGIVFLAVAFALWLTLLLWPMREQATLVLFFTAVLVLFFAAVVVSAAYGGLGPGLLATTLVMLVSDYFFMPLVSSLAIVTVELVQLGALVLVVGLISVLRAGRKRAEAAARRQVENIEKEKEQLATEISEHKQAEEHVRSLNVELERRVAERTAEVERSNEELRQFVRLASHDLQEPLRTVTSYVQLLAKRYQDQLDTDADEFISYAVEGTKRLQRLILDLLAYTEVETHAQAFTAVDCEAALAGVLADLRGIIVESGAAVTHEPLPVVWGDTGQIQLVFRNLLSNGIKFHSQELPRVHIAANQQGSEWVFSVQDNGTGIEPQYAERIFLVFQRLHARDPYPKPGIGLAICKKIVERHRGRIWVESEPAKGSTFFFTLPL